MPIACKKFIVLTGMVVWLSAAGFGQSLGDIAREQRQKQQEKKTASKVVTNEDIPEHPEANDSAPATPVSNDEGPGNSGEKKSADEWKRDISAQRQYVNQLQANMEKLNSSIHFAPGNCVRNCVQWNEHQVQKQDEVQRMQSQLEEQKKKLDDMQEAARKQGYGNSVYEPN